MHIAYRLLISMLVCVPIAQANSFGVRLEKDFYFQDFKDNEIEIVATNASSKLVFADIEVFEGRSTSSSDRVEFDLEKKVLNYDILPESFVVPAKQTRKIRLIRDASSKTTGTEEYYRIRVIPKSADAALKDNPGLLATLSAEDKQQVEDTQGANGSVRLFIGSGSVLIVQDKNKATPQNLQIKVRQKNDGIEFNILNNSDTSLEIDDLRAYFGLKSLPLGDLALRGRKDTTVAFSSDVLKKYSLTGKEDFEQAKFVAQDKKEHTIKVIRGDF